MFESSVAKARAFYDDLIQKALSRNILAHRTCEEILTSPEVELLPLLEAAYQVRKKFKGKTVEIHIINNTQNGFCPEDCHYCPQARSSKAEIEEYPLKSDEEILSEAKNAYEKGAFRYCMVFAGRGPSEKRVEHLARLVKKIKAQYPIEICVSAGLMNKAAVTKLKEAGLDRLNHNLNTSEAFYKNICTTHTFQDRLNTLLAAQEAGLEICSGLILGMGEEPQDVIEVAMRLRELEAPSIPVNFLVPVEGNLLSKSQGLTPEYCLRVLCLFRFLNPAAEIRIAAGREGHLRSLEVMSLYPANSLFLEGYLNTKGSTRLKTLRMIKDAGFEIRSENSLEKLLESEEPEGSFAVDGSQSIIKQLKELRPELTKSREP